MSKKNIKNIKSNDFLDMSYRKKINIDTDREYSDEELNALIIELNKHLQELNKLHKKLYSSNAYIERIYRRTFWDILREKVASILKSTPNHKKHNIFEKS